MYNGGSSLEIKMEMQEDQRTVAKAPSCSTGNDEQIRACMGNWEAKHVYPLVCGHYRELMRKSTEAVASASCGESRVGWSAGPAEERAEHEAWVNEDTLTVSSTARSVSMHLTTMIIREGLLLLHFSLPHHTPVLIFVNSDLEAYKKGILENVVTV